MFRRQRRLIGLLLPIALVAVHVLASQAFAQKQKEILTNLVPLSLNLTAGSAAVSACAQGDQRPQVSLNARAISPGGNPLRYRWSTDAGRISGDGSTVSWDLSGLAPGYYKAYVEVETGSTGGECQAFSSTNVLVRPCPPVQPVCPNVSIISPDNVAVDQPLTFSSNVSSVSLEVVPIYNWTVSAGRILEGQGTSAIRVDTTGLAGQTVRTTLSLGGYTIDCSANSAVQIPIPVQTSRKFDGFRDISRNDEKARLDNYVVELQNDPTSSAYVIAYSGRSSRPGDVQKHTARIVDYLVNSRGIDARRIVTLIGGARDELVVELWIAPRGAAPPTP